MQRRDDGERLDWKRPGLHAWQRRVMMAVTETLLADFADFTDFTMGGPESPPKPPDAMGGPESPPKPPDAMGGPESPPKPPDAMGGPESPLGLVPGDPAACARAAAWMDDALGRSSGDLRRGFVLLCLAMEWLPLFVLRTPTRMTRLPLVRRVAYLEALESSGVGLFAMLLVAFKVPLCIPAFESGAELASTGLDRPTIAAPRVRSARSAGALA